MAARFVSPFAPLHFSRYEADQLEELARVIIGQVMDQFESHLDDPKRFVDPTRWKLVKEREDVHVYKERSPSRKQRRRRDTNDSNERMASTGPTSPDRRFHNFSVTSEDLFALDQSSGFHYTSGRDHGMPSGATATGPSDDDTSDLPILLTVGTIQGDLYDTMYGVTNPTAEMMRIKTAYIQDGMIDSAVLARLKEPTMDDPFRSLSVKWCIKGQAIHLRTLVNNRDLVYLEATGLTRLPRTGELIGYQLLHSVEFRQTHRIPGCMRGNVSIVGLYRQHKRGVVELFGKGFVDPTGRIVRALVVKSASDAMLSSWRTIYTAQLKKLAYAVRRRHAEHSVIHARSNKRSLGGAKDKASCSVCTKPVSSLSLSFSKHGSGRHCRLCGNIMCTSCRVKRSLASIGLDGRLAMQQMSFCIGCIDAVAKASAFEIAVDELVQKDAHRGYGDGSLGSSLSPTESLGDRNSMEDSLMRIAF